MKFSISLFPTLQLAGLLVFFWISCVREKVTNNPESKLTAIPIPQKNIENFSEVFKEVSYLTVQLPPESYIGQVDKLILTDDHIFMGDFYQEPRVVVLDKRGKFLGTVGSFGEGPGQYTQLDDFEIIQKEKLIVLLSTKKLIYYDFEGRFLREIPIPIGGGYKFLVKDDQTIILYVPQKINSREAKYRDYILFQHKGGKILPIFESIDKLEYTPFFAERNNLALHNNQEFFTTRFSDTIYVFNKGILLEKMYLNFESSRKLPLGIFEKHDSEILNNFEFMQNYLFHMPNMHVNKDYLITCFRENNRRSTLIYKRFNDTSYSVANTNNDLDRLLPYLNVKYLKDDQIITCHYPEEFLNNTKSTSPRNHPLLLSLAEDEVDFILAFYTLK
tara:strand:- start:410 stop:1573 length:1164 start_codon:yes stop_codon:yes gene_type:complete